MTQPPQHITEALNVDVPVMGTSLSPPHALAIVRAALGAVERQRTKPHKLRRARPPDGLRTKAEAAAKLGCSPKTLDGYVSTGALPYVALGHGKKRQRKMFKDADLDEFIANQTRKDSPCPSAATRGRHSGNTASNSELIPFTEVQRRRTSAKPKR